MSLDERIDQLPQHAQPSAISVSMNRRDFLWKAGRIFGAIAIGGSATSCSDNRQYPQAISVQKATETEEENQTTLAELAGKDSILDTEFTLGEDRIMFGSDLTLYVNDRPYAFESLSEQETNAKQSTDEQVKKYERAFIEAIGGEVQCDAEGIHFTCLNIGSATISKNELQKLIAALKSASNDEKISVSITVTNVQSEGVGKVAEESMAFLERFNIGIKKMEIPETQTCTIVFSRQITPSPDQVANQ